MKTLEQKIKIMQAALDGKEVEIKIHRADDFNRHLDQENILWNWADYDYRIKPEPMEFWINVYEEKDGEKVFYLHPTKEAAERNANSAKIKIIKACEVTE